MSWFALATASTQLLLRRNTMLNQGRVFTVRTLDGESVARFSFPCHNTEIVEASTASVITAAEQISGVQLEQSQKDCFRSLVSNGWYHTNSLSRRFSLEVGKFRFDAYAG